MVIGFCNGELGRSDGIWNSCIVPVLCLFLLHPRKRKFMVADARLVIPWGQIGFWNYCEEGTNRFGVIFEHSALGRFCVESGRGVIRPFVDVGLEFETIERS